MKRLAILGSTGSIGRSALAVVDAHPDKLEVVSLAAGSNSALFGSQVRRFRPRAIAMATPEGLQEVTDSFGRDGLQLEAGCGPEGLIAVATHPAVDLVLCASSGTAGLEAALAAIQAGKTLALANKEILVMAGGLVTAAARRKGVAILPVDSEHNAIHQCLHGRRADEVRRIILTASGGPFLGRPFDSLDEIGPEEALRHPKWQMGRKITIDSATLMNKGLEVIEAHWLFGVDVDRIEVVIHPQSIVHSMVELRDGSVIAQLGVTDMKLPIQYAFSYPDRWDAPLARLDLAHTGRLDFSAPDHQQVPCLGLAYRALRGEPSLPIVLNAANEVAVAAFLDGRIGFTAIPVLIERTLDAHDPSTPGSLIEVKAVDAWARRHSDELLRALAQS
ncbi:MAG: 1-deoxy-D-xylulose-5-phosphate reductoisomerase [Acidobacteria bacterium]|nr:1-deoxy-D-xylulose-5-phosphate reductoisomerase [Acidobacteriota bacterium]